MKSKQNCVLIEGDIVNEVDWSTTKTGCPVASFLLRGDDKGHQVNVMVSVYGAIADAMKAQHLTRGMAVEVRATLRTTTWTDKKGRFRSRLHLVADEIVKVEADHEDVHRD